MTILQIHKYYYRRDGASNHMLDISALLEDAGHMVIPFAMKQEQSLPSPYDIFFVPEQDYSYTKGRSLAEKIRLARSFIYSRSAKESLERLLAHTKPDIAHIHNIYHHLTPSILSVLRTHNIPVVMTVHDYHLLAPNYTLFHHGAIHEENARHWYLSSIWQKAVKNSISQSMLSTLELIIHEKILRSYARTVRSYIAPSHFMKELLENYGKTPVIHLPHPFFSKETSRPHPDAKDIVYIGRLSEEKGLSVFLDLAQRHRGLPFRIIGEGPERGMILRRIQKEQLSNVTVSGFLTGADLSAARQRTRLLIVPSLWYENYPLTILESLAEGVLVLGSRRGGIPELLQDDLLFDPEDTQDIDERVRFWYDAPFSQRSAVVATLCETHKRTGAPDQFVGRLVHHYETLISSAGL